MASRKPLTASRHIRFGLYADSGLGKTRLIGTTPGKVLIVRSPVDHIDSILSAGMGDNIEERVISTWQDMWDFRDEARHEGQKWDWVWIDSWSLLQDVLMDDIWDTVVREKPARQRFGLDKQEYGINQHRMGDVMRSIVGADLFHFGWTAHAWQLSSPDLDEEGDPVEKLMPYIHGKEGAMAVKWCGYSNFIAYMRKTKKGARVLHTESSSVYYAKNQYEPKGEDWKMLNPTMPKILERIEKNRPRPKRARATSKKRLAGKGTTRRTSRSRTTGRS